VRNFPKIRIRKEGEKRGGEKVVKRCIEKRQRKKVEKKC
jgi:hypothetical protein